MLLPLLLLSLLGCVQNRPSPWVGDCAVYPEGGSWTYGEMGIGTCLAAPVDLRFLEGPDGPVLAVSNANAFRDFASGSVLFIDWEAVDLAAERNLLSELPARSVELPHFAGQLAELPSRGLLAVPVRYSEDARTRVHPDELYFVDVSDPERPALAEVAEEGSTLEVGSDPFAVALAPELGLLFVGNRTSHTVSVVDVESDPITRLDVSRSASISGRRWFDADGSGSHAAFSELELLDQDADVPSDTWRLEWTGAQLRAWLPRAEGGFLRYASGGQGWTASSYGTELDPDELDGVRTIGDLSWYESSELGQMVLLGTEQGILAAAPGDFLGDWVLGSEPLLEPSGDSWDRSLDGPAALRSEGVTYLFYEGRGPDGCWLGLATSTDDAGPFAREGDGPLLEPGGEHDAAGMADPWPLWDEQSGRWRLYYGAWSGSRWTIGLAWSDDLLEWEPEAEPVLALEGEHLARPVVAEYGGRFHLWALRRSLGGPGGDWELVESESVDGLSWGEPVDLLPVEGPPADGLVGQPPDPPGYGLEVEPVESFGIEGEEEGHTGLTLSPGTLLESGTYGWRLRVVAGELAELDEAEQAQDGYAVSSVVPEEGLAYTEQWDSTLTPRIGVASWDGRELTFIGTALEPGGRGSWDAGGVSDAVVVRDGGGWLMLYAGHGDGLVQVGRATSEDGLAWTKEPADAPVLAVSEDWDSIELVPGSLERLEDGRLRLWYTGSDGSHQRIGAAVSEDGGLSWERVEGPDGWLFGTGSPGDWDDSAVADPWVQLDGETLRLWYAGYDGSTWRIGAASCADDGSWDWQRHRGPDGSVGPVLSPGSGAFDYAGVRRPVLDASDGYRMLYAGYDAEVPRPGLAVGIDPETFFKDYRMPTAGDALEFTTEQANDGEALELDRVVEGRGITGTGLSSLAYDGERGFLYAASKLAPYVVVLDVRDDSETGFDDRNAMSVEAVLPVTGSGSEWFRALALDPSGSELYALGSSPEAVYRFSLSGVEDGETAELVHEALRGYLPAARGGERDLGADSVAATGPSSLAFLPDGSGLLVTNFNEDSLALYDLRMGAYGQLVAEVPFICEEPDGVVVSPDGRTAVVSCYQGEVVDDQVNSQLAVVDLDPESPTYFEVLTWIANR